MNYRFGIVMMLIVIGLIMIINYKSHGTVLGYSHSQKYKQMIHDWENRNEHNLTYTQSQKEDSLEGERR